MRTAVYLTGFLAAILMAPAAHAANYLSRYGGGSSSYMSDYSSGGGYYYGGGSGGYIRGGLTSGAGSIDRSGARRPAPRYVIVQQPAHDPCGIYNRAPTNPCRMKTVAWNPHASVSRTKGGLNIKPLSSLPPYFGSRFGNIGILPYQNNFVTPQYTD